MGIDTLSFEPTEKLSKPDREITLSGWRQNTLSLDAKIYLGFLNYISRYEIGINDKLEINSSEMRQIAQELSEWNFENSEYNPSYEPPNKPDASVPSNTPGSSHYRYGRGPNSSEEVNDLVYLLEKYSIEGGKLVYYY